MRQRRAGQFYSAGPLSGQWSWAPQGNASEVTWDEPSKSAPDNVERFVHIGDWVMPDGYEQRSFGTYNVQRVNRELIGDESCQNMVLLPSDEVANTVCSENPLARLLPPGVGTITDQSSGQTVDFFHSQIWFPPSPCRNDYLGEQICIRQWESWSHNNGIPGAPIIRKLERSVYLARGVGLGFAIDQTYPHSWHAELHSDWAW
jgi:hypothetical protein